jgi:hypothetical protein
MKRIKAKAITPIVTTILLVVVAVILVTIVLNWGKVFTTSSLNKAQGIELTQSDAVSFIYPTQLKDGIIQFNYSPPSSASFDDIVITSYKVLSDSGETPDTNLSSSYTLKQGSNLIDLTSFSSLGLSSSSKITIVLQTSDNSYIDIKNITNQFTAPVVNLPYVMFNNRKLYIQPSGSNANDGTGDTDTTFAWCDDFNWDNYACNPGTNFPAKEYCEELDAHGYDDWQLPSYMQLAAIWNTYIYEVGDSCLSDGYITTDCINNAISSTYNGDFVPFIQDYYWSSTEFGAGDAYRLAMYDGAIYNDSAKYYSYYVRCVRDQ